MRKEFSEILDTTLQHAVRHLQKLDEQPVGPTVSLEELRQRICRTWNIAGMDGREVVIELVRDVAGGLNNSSSARFFGWVNGGTLPSALAADWLTSTQHCKCSY